MTRSPVYALIGTLALAAAGTAAASIMTIDPGNFASGQYVSYATPGATLSTLTLAPVGPGGPSSFFSTFGTVLSPVYAVGNAFSPSPGGAGDNAWGGNNPLISPGADGITGGNCLRGCVAQTSTTVQWLEVNFSSPVNFVDVLQQDNFANVDEVAAFDSSGARVGDCTGYAGSGGFYPCISVPPSQFNGGQIVEDPWADYSVQDTSADISTLLIGAFTGTTSEIGAIQYGDVPEPAAFGLMALGLLGLAWSQRRRFLRA